MKRNNIFLELQKGFYDNSSRNYYYNFSSGEQISFKNLSQLVDSTYDSTFKILFWK